MNDVRTTTLILMIAAAATGVTAADIPTMQLAASLGDIIASERACALSYDQTAIANYVERSVPPDQIDFTSLLALHVDVSTRAVDAMTGSAKTAHCTAISRAARYLGFIE